jgi:putative addiction module component (TIGR02574 family)
MGRILVLGRCSGERGFAGVEHNLTSGYNAPMILERHPDIQNLSATEKLVLVTELWDDLAANPAEIPVTPEQIAELDRRMEEYRKDPTQVTSWEAIKERILGSPA